MKEDPEKFWDNIPQEINTPPSDQADIPSEHTTEERVAEEKKAMRYND